MSFSLQVVDLKVSLQVLVMDEADLLFSYGYEEDLKALLRWGRIA